MQSPHNEDDFDKVFGPGSGMSEIPAIPEVPVGHSTSGAISFGLAIAYIMTMLLAFSGIDGNFSGIFLSVLLAVLFNIAGLVFGLVGLAQKQHKRGLAVAGTILHGLFLLSMVILIVVILNEF